MKLESRPDLPLRATSVEVAESTYPCEVTCRECENLMLPQDVEGRAWACHVCRRLVTVRLRPK